MNLPPVLKQYWTDANGNPLAGGLIYTYQSGTTTPQATYTDEGGETENENPVELDASGYAPMWLDPELSYKFIIADSDDNPLHTIDNVVGLLTADAINTASIQDEAVTQAKIADDAVGADQLKDSVGTDGDRAVTTNHMRDAAVTRPKLASGAVGRVNHATKTTTYTLTDDDDVILANSSGGAFTLTLPAAALYSGRVFDFKKTDSSFNAVTIDGNGSETIGGAVTTTLNTQGEWLRIYSDGTNWQVLGRGTYAYLGALTTTGSWIANSTYTGYYWRIGDKLRAEIKIALSGAPTSTALTVTLPGGLSADTAKMTGGSGIRQCLGVGSALDGGSDEYELAVHSNDATSVRLKRDDGDGSSSSVTQIAPITFGNTDEIHFYYDIPISGWNP